TNVDPWSALRWANGRLALPDRARLGPDWGWWCAPLSEWDGTVKRSSGRTWRCPAHRNRHGMRSSTTITCWASGCGTAIAATWMDLSVVLPGARFGESMGTGTR